jgi:hypothetical protein
MKPIYLFAGILLFSILAHSQETRGQILGRVTDPSGAVMTGATVKAVDTATNVQTTTTTNASGDYVLPFLISGTYNVAAEMAGFRAGRRLGSGRGQGDTGYRASDRLGERARSGSGIGAAG